MKGVFSEGRATSERLNCFLLLNQHYLCQTVPRLAHFLSCIVRGVFLRGKFLSQKPPNWSDKWLVFVICIERAFERLPSDPEGGNGRAAFAEKALPLPKMSNNALFLSRLVKGVFLRENFLQEMLKSGLTIGPFLSYLLEGL